MKIDWQRVVANIRESRLSMQAVSRRCGMSDDWLRQFVRANHYEPSFQAGINLLRVHLEACGRDKHREVIKR